MADLELFVITEFDSYKNMAVFSSIFSCLLAHREQLNDIRFRTTVVKSVKKRRQIFIFSFPFLNAKLQMLNVK